MVQKKNKEEAKGSPTSKDGRMWPTSNPGKKRKNTRLAKTFSQNIGKSFWIPTASSYSLSS